MFLILIFMVMAGESFGYVVNPDRRPAQAQYLDDQLLFLDPTTEVLIAIVFPLMSSFFILLGSMMLQRIKTFHKRYHVYLVSITQATLGLSLPMIFLGIRFFLETVLNE